ncbi:MAG: redox-sensing transcriptional repressor Rex [Clostridia bacterium]|nr:redox-sensing transcriptional repressor Rex [Clostridia bacterium]
MAGYVSDAVIRRLPGYYRHLRELEKQGVVQISSQEMGKQMNLTPSQIRQDINCFGGFGRQGYGYKVSELKEHIGEILGLNNQHRMIIVGVGSIGLAVCNYANFSREGFETVALFDANPDKVGKLINGVPVLSDQELEKYISEHDVDIAVIAVPDVAAQAVMDRVAACGIKAVWNFAPIDLKYDSSMIVVNVHLSDSLQILSYKMAHADD